MNSNENLFEISIEWVQEEAIRIVGRQLSESELSSVKKGLEWGLLTEIDTVFRTAIENAVERRKS